MISIKGKKKKEDDAMIEEELAECPTCGENIPLEVQTCPECGEEFDEGFEEEVASKPMKERGKKKEKPVKDKKSKREMLQKLKIKAKAEKELDMEPSGEIKYTLLIIGILMCVAGVVGVVGLRLGFIQALLGDASAYPGIGHVEPSGHIVSIIPFVIGLVTIFSWGIKNDPLYIDKEKAAEEEEAFSFEEEVDVEEETEVEKVREEPVKLKIPTADERTVRKPVKAPTKRPVPKPKLALDAAKKKEIEALDWIDEEIDEEADIFGESEAALDELAESLADDERISACNDILADAFIYDNDRKELMKLIIKGSPLDVFKKKVKEAENKRKKAEAELKKKFDEMDADEIGQSLEDELAAELASLEEELEEDEEEEEEDLEEKILQEIDDLEDL
ncbi:MAG: hypothetical protein KAS67_06205 [Thermoplasmata archaeon]|nr:hypothetical protein [Thermoplasmata archaeon]